MNRNNFIQHILLFIYNMNDGTLGLHPFIQNTRMRLNMNFDANSGSYYFLPYR